MTDYRLESKGASADPSGLLQEFVNLPARVRQAPYDLGLPSPEAEVLLLDMPGFGEREAWVARQGSEVVARLGAALSPVDPTRGSIGFLEVAPGHEQAAALLVTAAERWLAVRGATTCYGPLCVNTWFPYRFRIDTSDTLRFSWEPVHPPTYPEVLQRAGYAQDMTYHSESMDDIRALLDGMQRKFATSNASMYGYREVRVGEDLAQDIPILHDISMRSFRNNHLFEPIPLRVFEQLYVAQARKRASLGCYCAVAPGGSEVGYVISFVDEAGQFVIKSIAVVPEHQGHALAFGLMFHTVRAAISAGHRAAIGAMLQAGNRSEFAAARSTIGWQHRYALFSKRLA